MYFFFLMIFRCLEIMSWFMSIILSFTEKSATNRNILIILTGMKRNTVCFWSSDPVGFNGTQNQAEQCSAITAYWSAALWELLNSVWNRLFGKNTTLMSILRQKHENCCCRDGGTTMAARRLVVFLLCFIYVYVAFTSVKLQWSYVSTKIPPGPPSTSGWVIKKKLCKMSVLLKQGRTSLYNHH